MEPETKRNIEQTVLKILENADMEEMTEYKIRKQAAKELNLELSQPVFKQFVRKIVENFLKEKEEAEAQEEEKEKDAASKRKAEQSDEEEVEEEEEEEEEEAEKPKPKKAKVASSSSKAQSSELQEPSVEESGDIIVCKLSQKRNVTISEFRGKKLVSIREYFSKDGKLMPTSKGISLTVDQWKALKSGLPAIENAIQEMQEKQE